MESAISVRLVEDGWALRWVRSVAEATAKLATGRADVVLPERTLPGASGDVLARRLGAGPTPSILRTARSAEGDRLVGFDFGAEDYVTKPFSAPELIRRLESVLRRHRTQRIRLAPDVELDAEGHVGRVSGTALHLTPMKFKLLAQLARRPGRVYSRGHVTQDVIRTREVGRCGG